MSVCGDGKISPNECDTDPPQYIYKIPHPPEKYDSIIYVYGTLQVPSHPSNTNTPQEESGLIY